MGRKRFCNTPATKWTGRVLNLKARHAVSIIAAKDWRLGVAFPRVITMRDDWLSPALEWQQGGPLCLACPDAGIVEGYINLVLSK